jgi:hypothetical protein
MCLGVVKMKIIKPIIFIVFSFIALIVLPIVIFILIALIQSIIFTPNNYEIWVVKNPINRLPLIYQVYVILILFYVSKKVFFNPSKTVNTPSKRNIFTKKKKRVILSIFAILNIFLIYTIIFNVTVITKNKIVNYSFFSPLGKVYGYHDIVKINAGIYGKAFYFPFTHSEGEFFYNIELHDGTKINLNEEGGAMGNDADYYSIIENLDKQFVNMDIPKVSSMQNFVYATQSLDKTYTDEIRRILENTRNKNK